LSIKKVRSKLEYQVITAQPRFHSQKRKGGADSSSAVTFFVSRQFIQSEAISAGEPGLTATEADTAERLLIEAAQKDPARFAEIYELNFNRVYGFIARRVGSRDIAEDLTSDVFHKALAGLPRFEWRGVPFGAWLIRIASNAIIDRAKRAANELDISGLDEPS
jgi:hypothetical protein